MKTNFFLKLFSIFSLVLISLVPLLWYKQGTIGMGHDMGWSLVPIDRLAERFWTWSIMGFGSDISLNLGTISFYWIEAFFAFLGLNFVLVQKFTFIFWFLAISFSMFYMARVIFRGKNSYLFAILAAIFYVLNHFTLHDWTVAEFSKFSAITFLPLTIGLLWQFLDNRISLLKFISLFALTCLFFNGGGASGLPIYGGIFITLLLLFLFKFFIEKISFKKIIKAYLSLFLVFILINSYWIIPLFNVIKTDYSSFVNSAGASSVLPWVSVISRNASFINLFRLQGFSSWYDTPLHPYSLVFLNNPIFIAVSLLFPLLAFSSVFLAKEKNERKTIIFFSFLALLSIFFTSGNHPPFGFVYEFLVKNVYGFAIFRTPFYKFGYAIWFSYSVLFAFTSVKLISMLKKSILIYLSYLLLVLVLLVYNYPFFTGIFFDFNKPFTTMIKLPNYVLETKKYLKTLPSDSRIFLLPPPAPVNGQTDVYNFGYFSRTPLPYQLTQKSIITNVEVNTIYQEQLTEALYDSILRNQEEKAKEYFKLLAITHVLVRKDVLQKNSQYRVINPNDYTKNLTKFSWIREEKVFGNWVIYRVEFQTKQISVHPIDMTFLFNKEKRYELVQRNIDISSIGEKIIVINNYINLDNKSAIVTEAVCKSCESEVLDILPRIKKVDILPTSPFYFLVRFKEQKVLSSLKEMDYQYLRFILIYSEKRIKEIERLAEIEKDSNKDKENLDEEQRRKILFEYKSLLLQIEERFDRSDELSKLEISRVLTDILKSERDIYLSVLGNKFFTNIEGEYQSTLDLLNKLISNEKFEQKMSYLEKNYIFILDIPEDGAYQLKINSEDSEKIYSVDGKQVDIDRRVYLKKGEHVLEVSRAVSKNILEQDTLILDKDNRSVKVEIEVEPTTKYLISLESSKNVSSSYSIEVISDDGDKKFYFKSNNSDINVINGNFITKNAVSKHYILKFSANNDLHGGRIQIKNLKVSKQEFPVVTAEKTNSAISQKLPSISYEFIDPTNVLVKIEKAERPFILLFKQTYSPMWQAKYGDGNIIDSHFPANLDFNAWHIDKAGDFEIKLNFKLQDNYTLGKVVSILTIIGLFSLLIIKKLLKKK